MTTRKYSKSKQSKKSRSKKEENKEDCPICLDELKKQDNIPKLKCKHKFHKQCLEPICRQRDNENVPCPLCRRDISFECASNITRNSPWKYSPHTNPTPFTQHQMMRMSMEERQQHHNEIQRHRRNYLARRRRTIARETSAERTAREQREQELETQRRQEMENFYNNSNHFSPRTPETPTSPNNFIPRTPDESPPSPEYLNRTPPLLTMEDLRTSPNSPSRTPPPLTMDDLRGGRRKKSKTKKSNYISMTTRKYRKSGQFRKSRKSRRSRKYRKKVTKKNKKGGNNDETGEYIRKSASWSGENQQTNVDEALFRISKEDFDPNGKTNNGEFLVFIAVRSKNMEIIKKFIKNPKLEKGFVIEILRSAIANKNEHLIDLIINSINKETIPRALLKLAS
tara:strand:+ start:1788 stop:2975 length:1188 start_codon:yes stop_codon:yes gene_type:complete